MKGGGRIDGNGHRRLLGAALISLIAFAAPAAGAFAQDVTSVPYPGDRGTTPVQPPGVDLSDAPSAVAGTEAPAPTNLGANFLATVGGQPPGNESGFIPPDTTGAIGPSNVVVPLNGRIKIFDRSGNTQYTATLDDFFSSVLPSGFAFDPRVEFDRISQRWFVVAVNGGANNTVMIATSTGPDVSAGESAFTFRGFVHSAVIPGDVGEFADYPTLAVDANALLIGTNNFLGVASNSNSLFVVNKPDLLSGAATPAVTGFQNIGVAAPASGMFTPQPVENDDPTATESYVIGTDRAAFSTLDFRRVTYPGGVPTLSAEQQMLVPATGPSTQVPAQGSTTNVDTTNDRLFEAMIARDPATGQPRIWTAHNFEVNAAGAADISGNRVGSRWYEIGGLSGVPSLTQSGTLFDPAAANPDSYFFPAIAANGQGHAVLGSSIAGPTRFIGIALAQRFAGEPAGTLSPATVPQPGAGPYTLLDMFSRNRWGDYSQVSIDPTDNMTFWAFQEYVVQGGAVDQWGVRVIEVKAPPPATPSSTSSISGNPSALSVTLNGTSTDGSGYYDPGTGFPKRISAAVDGGVIVNSVTFNSPTQVTLNLNTTGASPGLRTITITNPDGQSATGSDLKLDDVAPKTTITKKPKKKSKRAKAKVKFKSNEAGSTFECKLDRGKFKRCSSPRKLKKLKPKKHVFEVRAIDASGNVGAPAKAKFKVIKKKK